MTKRRHELSNKQYEAIRHLLPGEPERCGHTVDNHKFLNAVSYYLKTGTPWRDLPERYGHWKTVHRRFSRWAKKGLFSKIFATLSGQNDAEYAAVQLDSSSVKAHQHSAGGGKKRRQCYRKV